MSLCSSRSSHTSQRHQTPLADDVNLAAQIAYAGFDFDGSVYWERGGGSVGAIGVSKASATCENTNDEARIIRKARRVRVLPRWESHQ